MFALLVYTWGSTPLSGPYMLICSQVAQIEAAIEKEHAAMEASLLYLLPSSHLWLALIWTRLGQGAPNAGVKTTHLKTEARLRRWHGTITSPDKVTTRARRSTGNPKP